MVPGKKIWNIKTWCDGCLILKFSPTLSQIRRLVIYFLPKREKKITFSFEIPAVCWHYSELSKQSTGHSTESHTQSPLISFLKMSRGLCFEGSRSLTTTVTGSSDNSHSLSQVIVPFLPTLRKTALHCVLQECILLLGSHLIIINWLFISRWVLFKRQDGTH